MRDASDFADRAANCARALAEENSAELDAQLDAMNGEDLHHLTLLSQILAVRSRKAYVRATMRPTDA